MEGVLETPLMVITTELVNSSSLESKANVTTLPDFAYALLKVLSDVKVTLLNTG